MKVITLVKLLPVFALMPLLSFGQKESSGTIDYTMTMKTMGMRGGESNMENNRPRTFTREQQLVFKDDKGKFGTVEAENQRGNRMGMGTVYIDFKSQKYLRTFKRKDNDTTFYFEQPTPEVKDIKLTGKTKTILGYNAQEAKASMGRSKVTFWFTQDLPFSFSPMAGLSPDGGGVVLEITGGRMNFQASNIEMKTIAANEVSLPSPSAQISPERMRRSGPMRGNNRGQGNWNRGNRGGGNWNGGESNN